MRKRIWDATAVLSLLLFVAAAVMWVSSYWFYDQVGLRVGRHLFAVSSARGDTSWVWDTDYTGEPRSYARREPLENSIYGDGMAHYLEHRFAGFAARYHVEPPSVDSTRTTFRVLVVPYWFVLLVTAAAPAYWLGVTRRTRRRTARGECLGCGYDLRASTGRCPECGRAF